MDRGTLRCFGASRSVLYDKRSCLKEKDLILQQNLKSNCIEICDFKCKKFFFSTKVLILTKNLEKEIHLFMKNRSDFAKFAILQEFFKMKNVNLPWYKEKKSDFSRKSQKLRDNWKP